MTRIDQHSPSSMDPADYEFVGSLDKGGQGAGGMMPDPGYADVEANVAYEIATGAPVGPHPFPNEDEVREALKRYDGVTAFDGHFLERGGCDHCGQHNVRNMDAFLHKTSRELVMVGWQCADRFMAASRAQLAARQRIRREREQRERKMQCDKFLEEHPEAREAVAYLEEQVAAGHHGYNGFLFDVLHKFHRYGNLSERQVAAVLRSKERDEERAREREEERANDPQPAPVIGGQVVEVTGKVLTTKYKDTQYGSTLKMLVLDDRGFKVWGTVPGSIDLVNCAAGGRILDSPRDEGFDHQRGLGRGDRVTFVATVEASRDDETFGFFKRPRKAQLLDGEEEA